MADPPEITVVTWNLFHGHDGARLGPTLGSIVGRRPVDDGHHIHLNRTWIDAMGRVIRDQRPTVAALQEVPPQAVERLAEVTGMREVHSVMHPVIGPLRLRGWLADRNPDLWRTHEGTSNVILAHPDWVPIERWTIRHNPPLFAWRAGRRLRVGCREQIHWMLEPRRLIGVRLRHRDGRNMTAVSLHCHNSLVWDVIAAEMHRVLPQLVQHLRRNEPTLLAGDLNSAGSHHPAIRAIVAAGFTEQTTDDLVLDHIFSRNLTPVVPPTTLGREVLSLPWGTGAARRTVLLSDHDIVRAVYRIRDSGESDRS